MVSPTSASIPAEKVATQGAAPPPGVFSKLGLKDAISELEATARKTRDASVAAALQLWRSAEKRLGVEVDIDDPAMANLFGLHVLAVEELNQRVRLQAEATLGAVEAWSPLPLDVVGASLRVMIDAEHGDGSSAGICAYTELADANRAMHSVAQLVGARVQAEVYGAIEARQRVHDEVRENIRERQRWHIAAAAARRDVTYLRRSSGGSASGLHTLTGAVPPKAGLVEAEARLLEASRYVADLDGRILSGLLELQEDSADAVRRPWAALVQIQAEFFLAQQVAWTPVGEAFEEFADASVAGGAKSAQHVSNPLA